MNLTYSDDIDLKEVQEIDNIISDMSVNIESLDGAFTRDIPEESVTKWANKVKTDWEKIYNDDVPSMMDDLIISATPLRMEIDKILNEKKQKKE